MYCLFLSLASIQCNTDEERWRRILLLLTTYFPVVKIPLYGSYLEWDTQVAWANSAFLRILFFLSLFRHFRIFTALLKAIKKRCAQLPMYRFVVDIFLETVVGWYHVMWSQYLYGHHTLLSREKADFSEAESVTIRGAIISRFPPFFWSSHVMHNKKREHTWPWVGFLNI